MDKPTLDWNHQEVLKALDKLEDKFHMIIGFYKELGVLRQRRKYLVENLKEGNRFDLRSIDPSSKDILSKKVTFDPSYSAVGRRTTRIETILEKKKSIMQLYDLLGNLSTYHEDVNRRISDLQILKSQSRPDLDEGLEIDTVLARLQIEKDEIDNRIINFVTKNVIEGKEALLEIITNLENENNAMEDMINAMDRREDYMKDTIMALMLENQSLKKGNRRQSTYGERRYSTIVRKSVMEKTVSLILPESLRINRLSDLDDESVDDEDEFPFFMEQEDVQSVERSTLDSFTLDAALATWSTDERSLQEHVKRIGRDLEDMEVNQMKLNLLKQYIHRHGAKYINKNTLIDPSKGMSLWHGYYTM